MSEEYDDDQASDRLHRLVNGLLKFFGEMSDNETYAQKQETILAMITATSVFSVEALGVEAGYSFMLHNLGTAFRKVCESRKLPCDLEMISIYPPSDQDKIH